MSTVKKITGVAIAVSAAGLFLGAAGASAADEAIIHCAGVNACKGQGRCAGAGNACGANACKGQGRCATAEHSCKGANACKGKGILPMTAREWR